MFVVQVQYPNGLNGWLMSLSGDIAMENPQNPLTINKGDAEQFPNIERATWAITEWCKGPAFTECRQRPMIKIIPVDFEKNVPDSIKRRRRWNASHPKGLSDYSVHDNR